MFDINAIHPFPKILSGIDTNKVIFGYGFSFVLRKEVCYTNCMEKQHDKQRFAYELVQWYDAHARILPWRENITPYRVWVSEIMLQQTRVEAVKPYFKRFMKALPQLSDLAQASDDELTKLWEGLGYYNRVRNMKKCAITCMEKYGGTLPSTYEALLTLSGIGSYTAGAIASIAYKQCVPAVDGNVLRVFSRVLISEEDIGKESTKKKFQKIIQSYIPIDRSDTFNQALMEVGALICVPNARPRCNICPIAKDCLGYQVGAAHRLPNKGIKKARRIEKKTVLVVVCKDEVVLIQRAQEGLLAGLYGFCLLDKEITESQIKKELPSEQIIKIRKLHKAKHIFSHIEWHMKGYLVEIKRKSINGLWCSMDALEHTYAIPTALKFYRDALFLWMKERQN